MRFGSVPLDEAEGALLAHSQRHATGVIRKGTTLSAAHIAALREAGLTAITAAVLDPGDLHEDAAARRIAEAVVGENVVLERASTGRANLFAARAGLVHVDTAQVDCLNAIDPAITFATLRPFERVEAGRMVGTVKIIPFAVASASVEAACSVAKGALALAPWTLCTVSAISTELAALKSSVIDKTLRIFRQRLDAPGAAIVEDVRVPHSTDALARAIGEAKGETIVVFGASAVVDEDDVIPAAIRLAGGSVEHVGMPVDPGNLLVLGEARGRVVIGAPGCARSPKPNGFDIVLDRVLAGIPVGSADIIGMGVGGLLEETAVRPQPRRGTPAASAPQKPAALVLAAGQSTRMGAANKLLEEVGGVPMVRRVAEAAAASKADPVIVVTGHEAAEVRAALDGLAVRFVHNGAYADGLSTSLRAGLSALPDDADAAIVLLGDMPRIEANHCEKVLSGLAREGALIAIASDGGGRGNPVAWSARLFPELRATEGDAGGRALMSRYADNIANVEIGAAASVDADTPAALEDLRAAWADQKA